ncbi:MAG: DUF4149 domain-containing protein [Pseudomonadota bacterium]
MTFEQIAAVFAAMSLGAMIFFSSVVAPTTFRALGEEDAGKFLRALFPNYFEINGVVALAAAALALHPIASPVLVVAGIAMIGVKYALIPKINDARDRWVGGSQAAKAEFDRGHRLSVVINVVEMVALIIAIVILLA